MCTTNEDCYRGKGSAALSIDRQSDDSNTADQCNGFDTQNKREIEENKGLTGLQRVPCLHYFLDLSHFPPGIQHM